MVSLDAGLAPVIGDKSAKLLDAALGVRTVGDLMWFRPRRYATRGEFTDIARLELDAHATVMAEVRAVTSRTMRQRRGSILDVVVADDRGHELHLTFFNQNWRERLIKPGTWGLFSGRVSKFRGRVQLTHPECVLLPDADGTDPEAAEAFANTVIPIYPATAKLASWRIAKTAQYVLGLLDHVNDLVPEDVRDRHALISMDDAFQRLHVPSTRDDALVAQRRLTWEEAFLLLAVMRNRRVNRSRQPAVPRLPDGSLRARFDARLPFTLTNGQRQVGAEIAADLAQAHPMMRLLQGEVGSGKTLVALRAMLDVVDAGGQCVLLAPTEVLAQQHVMTLRSMLGPLGRRDELDGDPDGTQVVVLTGSSTAAQRRSAREAMESGAAGIIIGTHALLEHDVRFHDLALVVVDEQHRFGVEQRRTIRSKARPGTSPHVLVMTATPIPRTAAITVFGDLDVSVLGELPAGRKPIASHVVAAAEKPHYEARMWQRVREEVAKGHQAYVVCPRIQTAKGDDANAPAAAEQVLERLREHELSGLSVGLVHGRMPSDEKADAMLRFARGGGADGIDVLVATTVIEVGVDVPNASTMVVLDADRFGISQLHQLRGRVGRGSVAGLCFLHTQQPAMAPAVQRLEQVAQTNDGFALAQVDLEQRGEGDVLGTLQSGGRSSLRLLSVLRDQVLIAEAAAEVDRIFDVDPTLLTHPVLAAAIEAREVQLEQEYLEQA